MNPLCFILIFVVFCAPKMCAQQNFIEIHGKTNINSFKCVNDISNNFQKINFTYTPLPEIEIKVARFDCKNRIMTSDLKKKLSEKQFPNMYIRFLTFSKISEDKYLSVVEVKIMNKIQKYQIGFSNQNGGLKGMRYIKFSDFQITPPKKMGGMIVAKDDLLLRFFLNAIL
nr:hypothetical protein [Elizabethkingia sp. ASV34]